MKLKKHSDSRITTETTEHAPFGVGNLTFGQLSHIDDNQTQCYKIYKMTLGKINVAARMGAPYPTIFYDWIRDYIEISVPSTKF